jgi:membrane protease YdiL (CAAX protease family)
MTGPPEERPGGHGVDSSGTPANVDSILSGLTGMPVVTWATALFALFVLPGSALATDLTGWSPGPVGRVALQWTALLVVVGVTVTAEDRSLSSLGARWPDRWDVAYALVTTVAILVVFVATDPIIEALGLPLAAGEGPMATEAGIGLALLGALTTGLVEEVLYRGYPIERLLEYTDSALVSGAVTLGVFTVAHAVAWPLGNVVQVAAVSTLLTVVYLRRRTLVPVVAAHSLVWAFAVLGQFYG